MKSKKRDIIVRKINTSAISILLLLFGYPLAAQEVDFSGKWQLNHEKTQMKDMSDVVIEIMQKEDIIDYMQTVKSSSRDYVMHMVLSLDGVEGTYKNWQNKELKCSCVMENEVLKISYESHQRRSGKWVIVNMEEEHSVSPDGKTLSVIHIESWGDRPRGRWPLPMVFDKIDHQKSH